MKNKRLRVATAGILAASLLGLGAVIKSQFCSDKGAGAAENLELSSELTTAIVTNNSQIRAIPNLEELLPEYLASHHELSNEDRMLLEATVTNQDLIRQYTELVPTDFSFIAAQLYTEVGEGSDFAVMRCSNARSPACGSGQVKEIAFLETMYSMLSVPGGFNKLGRSKVATLNPGSLESRAVAGNERYIAMHNLAFSEMSSDILSDLDSVIATEDFSLSEYQENLEDRKVRYATVEKEYKDIVAAKKAFDNPRDDVLLQEMGQLRRAQQKDNVRLRKMLKQFWKKEILSGKTAVRNRKGKLLWYTMDSEETNSHWEDTTNLIGQLNMRREYSAFLGNQLFFDINSPSVQAGIAGYNPSDEYLRTIKDRYTVVSDFMTTQHNFSPNAE